MTISAGRRDKNGIFIEFLLRMLTLKRKCLQKDLPNLDHLSLGCLDEGRKEGGQKGGREGGREEREQAVGNTDVPSGQERSGELTAEFPKGCIALLYTSDIKHLFLKNICHCFMIN